MRDGPAVYMDFCVAEHVPVGSACFRDADGMIGTDRGLMNAWKLSSADISGTVEVPYAHFV